MWQGVIMTDTAKPAIHISDVELFLTCRAKWDYSSRAQHNLRPLRPNKHLLLGSAIHHALAAYYGSGKTRADWDREALVKAYEAYIARIREKTLDITEDLEEYFELGYDMLRNYLLWSPGADKFEFIMPEVQLFYDFGEFVFEGTADGIVRDEHGGIWILEHKTAAQFPSSAILPYTLQASMYCWVAQNMPMIAELGSFQGVMYNILKKASPVMPKPLKTGGLERRSNISCTPQLYMQQVLARGYDPKDYVEFANTLDPNMFNMRECISMPASSLQQALFEFRAIAKQMLEEPTIYRCAVLKNCSWCDYKKLCGQRLFGRGWAEIAKWDYEQNVDIDVDGED
jgi:hypothetical protein